MTPCRRRRAGVVAGVGLAAGAAVSAATAAGLALRRWERALDPTEGPLIDAPACHEVRLVSVDGAHIVATVMGPDRDADPTAPDASRRTIVLAHGWTNSRRVWEPVARRLAAAGHRVVLYDQRGHGASTVGSDGLALEALAADLCAVLEHFDVTHGVVAGHSMGGMAAQVMATAYPDVARARVGALVLVATACERVGTGRPATDRWARRVIAHRRVEQAMAARGLSPFLVRRVFGRHVSRAHLDAVCEMFVATPAEVRSGAFAAIAALDLSGVLGRLDLRVTVVAGGRDRLLPPWHARRIAQLIPGARLVTYEGTGHMVPLEEPERLSLLLADEAQRGDAAVSRHHFEHDTARGRSPRVPIGRSA